MASRARAPRWLEAARQAGRPSSDWLKRALGRTGAVAPHQLDEVIASGRVRLDGKITTSAFAPVSESSRVTVDGRPIDLRRITRALMLHKPSATVARGGRRDERLTVDEVLRAQLSAALAAFDWHAVGRLDADTTGILLFTNDERLLAHVTSPKTHLEKRYLATVNPKATDTQLEPLRQGITLHDGPARPARARLRAQGLVELTLTEGRHHQVKHMLAAVGLPVLSLHREAVGALELDVPLGAVREVSDAEIRLKLGFGG